jgi:hypothetical protein
LEDPMHIEMKETDSTLKHSGLYIKQSKMKTKFAQQNVLYTSGKKNVIKYIQWLQK